MNGFQFASFCTLVKKDLLREDFQVRKKTFFVPNFPETRAGN